VPLAARLQLAPLGPERPRQVRSSTGAIRAGTTPFTETRWRMVEGLEHDTLCRAFELDPVRHRFDLPRSARVGVGAAYATRGTRVSGFLERNDGDGWKPVGTIHVAREGERFRDLDVVDPRDQFSLDQTR
jgi:hypothetical protein